MGSAELLCPAIYVGATGGVVAACCLEGKARHGGGGALVPLVHVIAALRPAKPDSRWALRNHGRQRMAVAKRPYPENAGRVPAD